MISLKQQWGMWEIVGKWTEPPLIVPKASLQFKGEAIYSRFGNEFSTMYLSEQILLQIRPFAINKSICLELEKGYKTLSRKY